MSTDIHNVEPTGLAPPPDQFCRPAVPENGPVHLAPQPGTGDNFARMPTRLAHGNRTARERLSCGTRRIETSKHSSSVHSGADHDACVAWRRRAHSSSSANRTT